MRAVVCHDFDAADVEELPRPSPGAGEVLVEVQRVQLSVTECNLYRGRDIAHHDQIAERLEDGSARLFGHEFCGVVVEVSDDCGELETGDRVYAPGKIPCNECRLCRTGFELHCPEKTYIGYDIPGALAEYATFPAEALCAVPDGVTDAEVAAMQPVASAVVCVEEAGIDPGDVVAVVGAGVMGSHCAQLAREAGAGRVVAIDVDPDKVAIAEELGAVPVLATTVDPVERVLELTEGVGVDVVFEAVGGEQRHGTSGSDPLAWSVRMARPGGSVVQVGHIIGDVSLSPRAVRAKSLNWIAPASGATAATPNATTGEYAARLVADGRVDITDYITHELEGLTSFEEAVRITLNKERHGARGPAQLVL